METKPSNELRALSSPNVPIMKTIDYENERYPYSIVWTPIHGLTWFFPFIGHIGIGASDGIIYDFAGPYHVGKDQLAFGATTRYIQLNPEKNGYGLKGEDATQLWDESIRRANYDYERKMHLGIFQNCHSHVATILNLMQLYHFKHWNMIILASWMFIKGKFVSFRKFLYSFTPTLIVLFVLVALSN